MARPKHGEARVANPPRGTDTEALRLAYDALAEAPQQCRYHGTNFAFLGTEPWSAEGLPRCDSCKQPWRVVRALRAIEAVPPS